MATNRTSQGDHATTLALLWRDRDGSAEDRPRKGPRQRLDVGTVIANAIALADEGGLEALTVRAIANRLSVSPMSLYTYVPGKAELLDLMLDALYLAMPRPPLPPPDDWREALRTVAEQNRALFREHPWAAHVSTARPPLGPGLMAKYEYELGALEGLGLTDLEMDSALTYLLGFVQAAAVAGDAVRDTQAETGDDDSSWWEEVGPIFERFIDPADYPLATRVGTAAGTEQGAAFDPERAWAFGIERVLDGLGALIGAKGKPKPTG